MTTRCKFKCTSRGETTGGKNGGLMYSYKFSPVYSDDPNSENKQFWDYTPSGSLEFQCVHIGLFEVGKEYYLDLTEAVQA